MYECTAAQRVKDRRHNRYLENEEKADEKPWDDDC
jgi:hypothetical protein